MVTWLRFNKQKLPCRNFTFWEWFRSALILTRTWCPGLWKDGWSNRFVSSHALPDQTCVVPHAWTRVEIFQKQRRCDIFGCCRTWNGLHIEPMSTAKPDIKQQNWCQLLGFAVCCLKSTAKISTNHSWLQLQNSRGKGILKCYWTFTVNCNFLCSQLQNFWSWPNTKTTCSQHKKSCSSSLQLMLISPIRKPLVSVECDVTRVYGAFHRLVHGFLTMRRAEEELSSCDPGTFLLRFSFSVRAGLDIVYVDQEKNLFGTRMQMPQEWGLQIEIIFQVVRVKIFCDWRFRPPGFALIWVLLVSSTSILDSRWSGKMPLEGNCLHCILT